MAKAKQVKKPAKSTAAQGAASVSNRSPSRSKSRSQSPMKVEAAQKASSRSPSRSKSPARPSRAKQPKKPAQIAEESKGGSKIGSKILSVRSSQSKPKTKQVAAFKPPAKKPQRATAATDKAVAAKPAKAQKGKKTASAAPVAAKASSDRRSKSVGARVNSDSKSKGESETIVYKAGATVCFVNGGDKTDETMWDKFCLGVLTQDMNDGDTRAHVRRYYQEDGKVGRNPVKYEKDQSKSDAPVTILDFQIIAEVPADDVTADAGEDRLSLKKTSYTKLSKLFKNAVDGIMEKLGKVEGEEEQSGSANEESDEEESKNEMQVEKKEKAPVKPRTILRVKRKAPDTNNEETKKPAKAQVKKPAVKKASKSQVKKKAEDNDNEDQKSDEESEAASDQPLAQPQIGSKRKHPASGPFKAEAVPSKRVKRMADGSEKVTEEVKIKAKPQPKMPTVFKAGKWNPATELIEVEAEKLGGEGSPDFSGCIKSNLRNLHRAVNNQDANMLSQLVKDKKRICNFVQGWSVDDTEEIMSKIIKQNNLELLEALLPRESRAHLTNNISSQSQAPGQVLARIRDYYSQRVHPRPYLLNRIDTGHVSHRAYGTAIRAVNVTRGNRQGNNAFDEQLTNYSDAIPQIRAPQLAAINGNGGAVWRFTAIGALTPEFYKKFTLLHEFGGHPGEPNQIAMTGNRELVMHFVGQRVESENFGYNKLHLDVLKLDKLTEKYATVSITKKAVSDANTTPLHLAAINPNECVIEKLLAQNPDINVIDTQNQKPIHYAACCTGPGPLRVLLAKGANVFDLNLQKLSALHFAAINGRAENVRVILDNQKNVWKLRDKKNKTAMAYACENGDQETIKAFLDSGVAKINAGQGPNRMPPLSFAAQYGRYELCEWLIANKARVLSKDKYARTPLMMAVRNGHVRVASLLLQNGSEWDHVDSSQNSVLHYAAGFGWKECIDLLVKHGANINAENMWKITPITIAMLKNHQSIVKELLKRDDIDVNGKDDQGRTLLTLAITDLGDPAAFDFIKFLVQKGADPTVTDVEGNTLLHRLADYNERRKHGSYYQEMTQEQKKQRSAQERETLLKVTRFLIDKGTPLSALNEAKQTAFAIALKAEHVSLLDMLSEDIKISECPKLLHTFKAHIFDDRFKNVLMKMVKREHVNGLLTPEVMNTLNKEGFTPFLSYIRQFSEMQDDLMDKVQRELAYQIYLHKERTDLYVISNIDLFSPKSVKDAAYQLHSATHRILEHIDEPKRYLLQKRFFHELIAQEFVKLLQFMVENGANPHATVDKLEFYRKLDDHKKHLILLQEQRTADQAVQDTIMDDQQAENVDAVANAEGAERGLAAQTTMINTGPRINQQQAQASVKTRQEVLAEQKYERNANKKLRKGKKKRGNGDADEAEDPNDPKVQMKKQLKEFYAQQKHSPTFVKKGGKKVELQYSKEYGMQGAMHIIMSQPNLWVVQYFMNELGLEFDSPDYSDKTPFSIGIDWQIEEKSDDLHSAVALLLESNVNFDYPDEANQTPYLKLYNTRLNGIAENLRDRGANINQMSRAGIFVLKIALIRRDDDEIKRLVSLGADINQVDQHGRNLLHFAINMSSATADATFETEQVLIDLGINANTRDCRGRVPLHYCFVKMKNYSDSSAIDPIESVSSLCAIKDLEIEVQDKWNKTPLHYAAQRCATISSLYILQRGAQLESKDIYGNTPLAVALQRKHFNYGIILIQKNADVTVPVYEEFPNRIAKMWKAEEKKAKQEAKAAAAGDVHMDDDGNNDDDQKKHRNMFNARGVNYLVNNFFFNAGVSDSDYDSDEEDDSESDNDGHQMETNLMTSQNYFQSSNLPFQHHNHFGGQRRAFAFAGPARAVKKAGWGYAKFRGDDTDDEQKDSGEVEPEKPPRSAFRTAIRSAQQGIAYLILDNGYDYMLAMQDALDEKKFQLFLTLIQKTADDAIVQKKNEKGQNLMHILATNSASSANQMNVILRIFNTLKGRGVDCLCTDSLGNNALHYAVKCQALELVNLLLENSINVNIVNHEGHSPLSIALKGEANQVLWWKQTDQVQPIWKKLLDQGADPNIIYPEDTHQDESNGLRIPKCDKDSKKKRDSRASADLQQEQEVTTKDYRCTIMINYILHDALKRDDMLNTFATLVTAGGKFDGVDSEGYTVLDHAIIKNNNAIVNYLLSQHGMIDVNHRTPEGLNAVHLCVKPLGFGSYENVNMLEELQEYGFDLRARDCSGKTPLDYAMGQDSKVMAKKLCNLIDERVDMSISLRRNSLTPESEWPLFEHNFTDDAQTYLDQAEAKRSLEVMETKQELDYVPLDREFAREKQYKVYYDDSKRPWDAYMTKVDLKNGVYGDYVYYKMQMVFDSNRELYIVLTRYGRIGELGMHQRTPFTDVEEAKKEFKTIFKQKSGNDWDVAQDKFVSQKKKYELTKVNYTNVKHQDYLAPFDYENCSKSSSLPKAVEDLVEEISNVTMYQRAIKTLNIDEDKLPCGSLKKESIEEAYTILLQIKAAADQLQQQRQLGIRAQYDDVMALYVKLSDLSSKFYQLIPQKVNDMEVVRPMSTEWEVQQQITKVDNLVNIEFTSRLLLAAIYRQYTIHPIQYIYNSLGVKIELLEEGDPECDLIRAYCLSTARGEEGYGTKIRRIRVFKVERRGEQERFESVAARIGNRRLLFHGSGVTNFLGLLSQGMRIAPPEAPATGYMFGKGCYFADMMEKSMSYAAGYKNKYLLLCDVALGKAKKLFRAENVERLDSNFHSVRGCGSQGPDFKNKKVVTPQGYALTLGKAIKYDEPSEEIRNQLNQPQFSFAARFGNPFNNQFGGQQQSVYTLRHNEYVVYSTDQIRQRYLIQLETGSQI